MQLPANLTHNKILLYGLPVVVVLGLYVLYKNSQNKTATPTTAPGTTTTGNDISGLSSDLSDALTKLSSDNTLANQNLANLITGSDSNFVSAINDQSTGISAALQSLSTDVKGINTSSGLSDIEKAIVDGNTTLSKSIVDAINSGNTSVGQAIKDSNSGTVTALQNGFGAVVTENQSLVKTFTDYVSQAFSSLTASNKELADVATGIAKDTASNVNSLSVLTQSLQSQSDKQYLQIGLQSAASCWHTDGGSFDENCISGGKLVDWTGSGGVAGRDAQIKAKYAPCYNGSTYDLVCVGKQISSAHGGN